MFINGLFVNGIFLFSILINNEIDFLNIIWNIEKINFENF